MREPPELLSFRPRVPTFHVEVHNADLKREGPRSPFAKPQTLTPSSSRQVISCDFAEFLARSSSESWGP